MSRWLANPHQEGAAYRNFDKIFDRKLRTAAPAASRVNAGCSSRIACLKLLRSIRQHVLHGQVILECNAEYFQAADSCDSGCRRWREVVSFAASVWWFPWFWICSTPDYSFLPKPLRAEFRRELNRSDRLRLPYRHRRRIWTLRSSCFSVWGQRRQWRTRMVQTGALNYWGIYRSIFRHQPSELRTVFAILKIWYHPNCKFRLWRRVWKVCRKVWSGGRYRMPSRNPGKPNTTIFRCQEVLLF